ncbi:MAG: endonuclease III domain-containing protein [Candidatus Omnitrophota bacterium]
MANMIKTPASDNIMPQRVNKNVHFFNKSQTQKSNKKFSQIYQKLYSNYGAQYWWPAKTKIEMIVGAVLTQNTAWSNVELAIKNLKQVQGLSIKTLKKIKLGDLANLIRPSGYYNLKAIRIKNFIKFLMVKYSGSLKLMCKQPTKNLREQLLSVNGLGPETVDCILLYAGRKRVFVVDAYTRRIFDCQGLINRTDRYEEIQKQIMFNLPRSIKIYNQFHALIVALGKNICRKRNPLCPQCLLLAGRKKKKTYADKKI